MSYTGVVSIIEEHERLYTTRQASEITGMSTRQIRQELEGAPSLFSYKIETPKTVWVIPDCSIDQLGQEFSSVNGRHVGRLLDLRTALNGLEVRATTAGEEIPKDIEGFTSLLADYLPKINDGNDEMLLEARLGNAESLNNAIKQYEPFVHKITSRMYGKTTVRNTLWTYPDALQQGRIGLRKAIATYDWSFKFMTYAGKCIRMEIAKYRDHLLRNKRNFSPLHIDAVPEPGYLEEEKEEFPKIDNLMRDTLTDREITIIGLRMLNLTYKEIASYFGTSKQAMEISVKRSIRKLRTAIKNRTI